MKYDNQNLPTFFQEFYRNKDMLNLRNNKDFITPFHRLHITQRSVDYVIPKFWNKLPDNIKGISNYRHFVKIIKNIFLNKYN